MEIVTKFNSVHKNENSFIIHTDSAPIKVVFLTDDILRIRAGFDGMDNGEFKEESYCLMMTGWEDRMDSLFEGKRKRITCAQADMHEDDEKVVLRSKKLEVVINKDPFKITVFDENNTCLYADIPGIAYMKDSNNRRIHCCEIDSKDCFYGFGEKTGKLNKAMKSMKMCGRDAMGYNPEETDGLYKHIPFYIKLNSSNKKAVGFFYHNTYECEFSMGREHSNYWKHYSKYIVDGGDIDLFIINGPEIKDVVRRYTDLTGKSAMLPAYALGYLGSSMYYPELEADCDDAIVKFIEINNKEDINIDGFQLSSGYTVQNNKRCTFTWNYDRFKNPEKFFEEMENHNVTVSPNVKPGMLLEHPLFDEMNEKDLFIKDSKGQGYGVGCWWGGKGAFVDFTSEKNRNTWEDYLKETVIKKGTSSVWNDNCEYDSLVDKDCVCSYEGESGTVGQLKSVMANLMCYTTEKAIKDVYKNTRPYIVCRAGFSGIQQYAQTWAGDNLTCWEALKYNIATILGMSLSGVANQGCDIGGFYGPAPEAELLVRWVQNGIFQPRFSIHSTNTDNTVTEPWMYPEYTKYIRDAIKLRYQLMPYTYSLMEEAHREGTPIMRPMVYEFQNDMKCHEEGVDFMIGESLLVANVVEKGAKTRKIYMPEGSRFFDFNTRNVYEGGQSIEIPVDISSIPMFIRDGGIVPFALNDIKNLHKDKIRNLGVLIEPSRDNSFDLYEDDGISFDFENGGYCRTKIDVKAGEKVVVKFSQEGNYESTIEDLFLDLICRERGPYWVTVNGRKLNHYLYMEEFKQAEEGWIYNHSLKSVQIKYPEFNKELEVVVSFEEFDLLGM